MASNFNNTTPAAPAGNTNVKFQTDGAGNDSAYVPTVLFPGGVNAQTSTTYNILSSDNGKLLTLNNAAPVAVSATNAPNLPTPFAMFIENLGVGLTTVTATTSTIDGAATLTIKQNTGVVLFSDGTNYFTERGNVGAELTANKDVASGYAGLDNGGLLKLTEFPTSLEGSGGGAFCFAYYGQAVPYPAGGQAVSLALNNLLYSMQIVGMPMTVRKITIKVIGNVVSSKIYIGIYDHTGTAIANANVVPSGAAAAIVATSLGTPVTLNPGFYYVFCAADTTGITLDGNAADADVNNFIGNNVTRMGLSTNGITGAAVPPTLGVLTQASIAVPFIMFEA